MFFNLRKVAIGAVAAFTMAGAVQAATVDISGAVSTTGGFNNFATQLNAALGGSAVLLAPASLTTVGQVHLTFTAIGAESGLNNSFSVAGLGTLSETSNFGYPLVDLLTTAGSGSLAGVFSGLLDGLLSFSNFATNVNPGSGEFGVFAQGGAGEHSVFFLAFDDNGAGPDDNHDDFLIRVNVVPLPAGGLLLIGGLGALAAIRRRRKLV
jgi:hypothetical protein